MIAGAPLLAAALALGAGGHGRLALQATATGGWASDPYVGAGRGQAALFHVAPAARLDLSLAPSLKLAATGEAAWSRFQGADFDSTSYGVSVAARVPGEGSELSLTATAQRADHANGVPAAELAAAPVLTRATGAGLTAGARMIAGPTIVQGAVSGALRQSRLSDGDASEQELELAGGVEWPLLEPLALGLGGRWTRTASGRTELARREWETGVSVLVGPVAGSLSGGAHASLGATRFDAGVSDTVVRMSADLAHPLGPVTALAGWSLTWSDGEGRAAARRQVVFLGLRGGARVLSW